MGFYGNWVIAPRNGLENGFEKGDEGNVLDWRILRVDFVDLKFQGVILFYPECASNLKLSTTNYGFSAEKFESSSIRTC